MHDFQEEGKNEVYSLKLLIIPHLFNSYLDLIINSACLLRWSSHANKVIFVPITTLNPYIAFFIIKSPSLLRRRRALLFIPNPDKEITAVG